MKPSGEEKTVLARSDGSLDGVTTHPTLPKRCDVCGTDYPPEFVVCPKDATPLLSGPSHDDPLMGIVLGGTYKIVGLMAAGGMGRLYEAEHLRIERRFALKVIHESYAAISDLVARFDREARAMSKIKSLHVVQVLDVMRAPDGRPVIVFEKLEGEDLEDHLEKVGRLPLRKAIGLARQLCRGLAAAHSEGIVHRDLKPSNLFLCPAEDGGVMLKILDFGVAKLQQDANLTATGAVVGTPAYMAPEQARSSASVDVRSDVYAVGAVLYRMITGRAPYAATDATATLASVLEREPTRPTTIERSIPIGMEALVQRAMAREIENRPQSVGELDAELAAFEATLAPDANERGSPTMTGLRASGATLTGAEITRRARRARPIALALILPVLVLAGVAVGGVLAAVVQALSGTEALTSTELILVGLAASVAGVVGMFTYIRALGRAYGAVPAVQALVARVARALLAMVAIYGVLEIGARVWSIAEARPVAVTPLGIAGRIAVASLIALLVLFRKPKG